MADLGIAPKTNESSETQNHEMLHLEIIRLVEKMETVIEPETVVEEIASTPAIEELPNHQSINDILGNAQRLGVKDCFKQ